MKYIVLEVESGDQVLELPVIFPNVLVHEAVYKALVRGLDDSMIVTGVVGAGFCNSIEAKLVCTGASDSLNVKSRGEVDTNLIKMIDYTHGIT